MKYPKSLWQISITTTREAEDAVAEMLGSLLGRPVSCWLNVKTGVSTVSAFCEQRPGAKVRANISAALKRIKDCGLKIDPGKITVVRVRREDWAESWKRHFKAIEIGNALLIQPGWSKRKPRPGQAVIVLDPGLGFGTGQHPTTAFCLRALARCGEFAAERSFLDIGTGSGILAIAAARLGYSPVRAIDVDPEAVRVARANARANGVESNLRIVRGDVSKLPICAAKRYDLVCANLTSTLLVTERRRIAAQLKPGGTLVLAGILKSEFSRVQRSFMALGLELAVARTENEWRSGSFRFARKIISENLNDKRRERSYSRE